MNIVLFDPAEVDADGRVGLIDGPMGVETVAGLGGGTVALRCAFEAVTLERPRVDLLLALPRPKVLRRLWAHLAALGVGRVMLTNAGKVERDYFDSHIVRDEGFRPLLIEGLQQARDTRLPIVTVHKRLTVLVEDELDALCPGASAWWHTRTPTHRSRLRSVTPTSTIVC